MILQILTEMKPAEYPTDNIKIKRRKSDSSVSLQNFLSTAWKFTKCIQFKHQEQPQFLISLCNKQIQPERKGNKACLFVKRQTDTRAHFSKCLESVADWRHEDQIMQSITESEYPELEGLHKTEVQLPVPLQNNPESIVQILPGIENSVRFSNSFRYADGFRVGLHCCKV